MVSLWIRLQILKNSLELLKHVLFQSRPSTILPVYYFSFSGNVAGADFLARHGANLKATNSRTGFTLLHHAAESMQERNEVAQWVETMKDRVSVNEKDNNGR